MFSKIGTWFDGLYDHDFLAALSSTEKRKERIQTLRLLRRILFIVLLAIGLMIFLMVFCLTLLGILSNAPFTTSSFLPVLAMGFFTELLCGMALHKTDEELKILFLKDNMESK